MKVTFTITEKPETGSQVMQIFEGDKVVRMGTYGGKYALNDALEAAYDYMDKIHPNHRCFNQTYHYDEVEVSESIR